MLRFLILFLFTLPSFTFAWAQPPFYNLAANGDGSQLWFSSWLRMRNADQYSHPKIFVWDEADGVQLYHQEPATISISGARWWSETAYKLVAPSVSADGNVVASVGEADCYTGTPCATTIERYASRIRIAGGEPRTFEGGASLSPNGRFAYLNTSRFTVVGDPAIKLVDLLTGAEVEFEGRRFELPNRHRVANDGTVLLRNTIRLPDGEIRELDFASHNPHITMLNDSATRVVYATGYGGVDSPQYIAAYDVETGEETVMANLIDPIVCDMSNDGEWIAYIDRGQAWVVNWDNTRRWRVTFGDYSIAEVALSGDGSQLFVVTADSRILRIGVHTRRTTEIVPATPAFRVPYPAEGPREIVAGSTYTMTMAAGLPLVSQLLLSGVEQYIIFADSRRIGFQAVASEDTPAGWAELVFAEQPESPFVSSAFWGYPIEPAGYAPYWHRRPDWSIVAMHQDYASEVTWEKPARPGEIVHVYGYGFGPVDPPVETGQPAPASPLSSIAAPIACHVWQESPEPVEVLFGGLAPGWIGLYQFDVRLPDEIWDDYVYVYLGCGRPEDTPGGTRASGMLPVTPNPATE